MFTILLRKNKRKVTKEKKKLGKEREAPLLSPRAAWEDVISLRFCSEAS